MSRVGSLNDEELAWLVALSTLPGAPPIGKTIRELLGYRRALRALARHAKRLRKQRNAWARAADQVDELNAKFIALRTERDAARAALLELAKLLCIKDGPRDPIIDPSGKASEP